MQPALRELIAGARETGVEPAALLRHARSQGLALSRDDLHALFALAGTPDVFAMPGVVTGFLSAYLRGRSVRPRVVVDLWAAAGWMLPPLVEALSPTHAIGVVPDDHSAGLVELLAPAARIDWRTADVRAVVVTLDPGIDVVLGCPPWRWQPSRIRIETADGPLVLTEDPANVALLEACSLLTPDGIGLFVVGPGFVLRPGPGTAFPNLDRFGLSLHLLLELPRGIVTPDSGSGRLLIGIGRASCPVPLVGSLTTDPQRTAALLAALRRAAGSTDHQRSRETRAGAFMRRSSHRLGEGCVMSETMMAQGRAEVDEANRRFMEAFERGDAASVAALYAEDAVVLPPDAPMISGRAAIEEFWRGLMAAGARGVNLVTLRLAGSGDVLHEVGRATITIQPEDGETSTQTVKYVVVWERDPAGGLALAVDTWNGESAG